MQDTALRPVDEIQNLISRYTNTVNRREWGDFSALFAKDAIWEAPGLPDAYFSGRDEIVQGIVAIIQSSADTLIQLNTPAEITIDGEGARARCTIRETGSIEKDQVRFEAHGIYDDELVRRDGAWQFAHRTFVVIEVMYFPLSGKRVF